MTFDEFLRGLEMIANRRPGSYHELTTIDAVVAPEAIAPKAFFDFLVQWFDMSPLEVGALTFAGGSQTLEELYAEVGKGTRIDQSDQAAT